jgi:hypothetical protein
VSADRSAVDDIIRCTAAVTFLALLACAPAPAERQAAGAEYLYLWTASADSTQPDFLAVLDVHEDSGRYGRLVTTLPVPGYGETASHPHSYLRRPGGHVLATFQKAWPHGKSAKGIPHGAVFSHGPG